MSPSFQKAKRHLDLALPLDLDQQHMLTSLAAGNKKPIKSYIFWLLFMFYDLIHISCPTSSKEASLKAVKLSQSKMRYPNLRG